MESELHDDWFFWRWKLFPKQLDASTSLVRLLPSSSQPYDEPVVLGRERVEDLRAIWKHAIYRLQVVRVASNVFE